MRRVRRDKKFLGALIGGIASIIGSGISGGIAANNARKTREAQEKAIREQQITQNQMDTLEQANILSNKYNSNGYADGFTDRITYKCGGRKKKTNGGKFSCGRRKKGFLGLTESEKTDLINNGFNTAGNILNSVIQGSIYKPIDTTIKRGTPMNFTDDTTNTPPSYIRNQLYKCGGKKRKK